MRRFRVFVGLALFGLILAVPGCGRRMVKIKGKFLNKNGTVRTFSEQEYVTLQFVPVDSDDAQKSYPATIDKNSGSYVVEIMSGQYRVSFVALPSPVPTKNGAISGPPLVKRPGTGAADITTYDFSSSTTHDITVP